MPTPAGQQPHSPLFPSPWIPICGRGPGHPLRPVHSDHRQDCLPPGDDRAAGSCWASAGQSWSTGFRSWEPTVKGLRNSWGAMRCGCSRHARPRGALRFLGELFGGPGGGRTDAFAAASGSARARSANAAAAHGSQLLMRDALLLVRVGGGSGGAAVRRAGSRPRRRGSQTQADCAAGWRSGPSS